VEKSMPQNLSRATATRREAPDRLILAYSGDSGLGAMLVDVLKKAVGTDDCPLCEITHGPLGKRDAWSRCEAGLGVIVDELHRDQLPDAWGILRSALPSILGRVRDELPFVLLARSEIEECDGDVDALEHRLRSALTLPGGEP
jgi:hypothetical protein